MNHPSLPRRRCLLWMLMLSAFLLPLSAEEQPWPAPVAGFQAPQAGEHPRLFFREGDIARLRERANTPFGRAIIRRLREQLDGENGETAPGEGEWTMSSVAGYGFLYVLTGDEKYAQLGRETFEQSLAGATYKDDDRYAFVGARGALRAGPALGWHALGYDLCYHGWSEEYRNKVRDELFHYDDGDNKSLEELARGSRHGPHSNHWGMQIGGAAMALLALKNDPGVDMDVLQPLIDTNQQTFIRKLTEGYGDGGYFREGDGTGSMGYIAFIPAMQAYRVAGGLDYVSPRPNGQWVTRRWLLGTVVKGSKIRFHSRDGYPHNVWDRDGISGGNYFGIGMGVSSPAEQQAWKWFYQHNFKASDSASGTPYDTVSYYPHHSILSFVNWALSDEPINPAEVIPRASIDHRYNYCMFRNRWQDENDLVVTFLATRPRGHTDEKEIGPIWITEFGEKRKIWGSIRGEITHFSRAQDGSSIIATDSASLAVDFSGACGTDGMLVLVGPGAPDDITVQLDGHSVSFRFLGAGTPPTPMVDGDRVLVGDQTVTYDDGLLALGVMAPPWDGGGDERHITIEIPTHSAGFAIGTDTPTFSNPATLGPVNSLEPQRVRIIDGSISN